jgi:hypothetical protein
LSKYSKSDSPRQELDSIWQRTLDQLRLQMTRATFDTWLQDTQLIARNGEFSTVAVKNKAAQDWLQNRLYDTVQRTLSDILDDQPVEIEFQVAEREAVGESEIKTDQQPKKFPGFPEPKENWSKLPHTLIEYLHLIKSAGELNVILYVLRHTWGYHDTEKKITLDEFKNGRKRKDGTRIDKGTGLAKVTIISGIKKAVEHGFLKVETDDTDRGRIKKYYSLKDL